MVRGFGSGAPDLPTQEEIRKIEPIVRQEMSRLGATEIAIMTDYGMKAVSDFPMNRLPRLVRALFEHGILPVKLDANTLGFAVRR